MTVRKAFRRKFQMDTPSFADQVTPRQDNTIGASMARTAAMEWVKGDVELLTQDRDRWKAQAQDLEAVVNKQAGDLARLGQGITMCTSCDWRAAELRNARKVTSQALLLLDEFLDAVWYDTGLQVPDDLMERAHKFRTSNFTREQS